MSATLYSPADKLSAPTETRSACTTAQRIPVWPWPAAAYALFSHGWTCTQARKQIPAGDSSERIEKIIRQAGTGRLGYRIFSGFGTSVRDAHRLTSSQPNCIRLTVYEHVCASSLSLHMVLATLLLVCVPQCKHGMRYSSNLEGPPREHGAAPVGSSRYSWIYRQITNQREDSCEVRLLANAAVVFDAACSKSEARARSLADRASPADLRLLVSC